MKFSDYHNSRYAYSIELSHRVVTRIEEDNSYYPYGMSVVDNYFWNQPYKFGGKKLDRMNGLDLYDFGARMLDSAAPTWGTPDPMAELDYSISPYVYCRSNPVNMVDFDGKFAFLIPAVPYIVEGALYVGTAIVAYIATQNIVNELNKIEENGSSDISNISELIIKKTNKETSPEKKVSPKKEAREKAKEKRDNQPASEKKAKDKGKELEKARGKDARREAHDKKGTGDPDRSKKQIDEDYAPNNYKPKWKREDRGKH